MRTILLIVCCLAILPLAAFCQNAPPYSSPQWFDDIGSSAGSANATAVQVDASGNSFVTGSFSGTVDFDPSTGINSITAPSGASAGFIAKYQADGTLAWVYPLAGASVVPNGITLSPDGSITLTGKYTGTMDANPGLGIQSINSAGGNDAFVIHLNNNGGFLWAKSIGDTGEDIGNKVASDGTGNLYVAMQFQGTVVLTGGGTPYTAKGTTDGMLVKYDAAGNVVFGVDLGYAGNAFDNTVSGVVVDKNGNVDVIGYINGPIDFNPLGTANLVSNAHSMYLAQYTSAGILNWVKTVANNFQNNNNINLAIDGSNSIYICGAYNGQITFATGDNLTGVGNRAVFMAQYYADGTLRWHKSIGGVGATLTGTALGVSPDNQTLYLSGYFTGAANFDTGSNSNYLTYNGQKDIFLAKYTASTGEYRDAVNFGNGTCTNTQSNGMAVTTNGDVMLTGAFCGSTNFSGASCTLFNEQAQSSSEDMFLVRYTLVSPIANNAIGNPQNCPGAPAGPLILMGSTPTGGAGTYSYEWQRSTDGMTFIDIGVYDKDYPAPAGNSLVYYIRKVFSGCATPSISSVLQVGPSVNGPVQNNIIDASGITEGCGGAGSTNLTASLPTGGGGNYTYLWQTSRNKIDWTDIVEGPITTPTSQNLGAISYLFTFYVRRLVTTPGCNTPSISPVVTFPALPRLNDVTIHATGTTDFCGSGDPGTLTGDKTPTGGTGVYTYQWKSTTTNDFEDIPGPAAKKADYVPGIITQTTYFKREVLSGPCYTGDPGLNSNPIIVTIKPLIKVTNNTIAQATPDGVLCLANADPSMIIGQLPGGGSGTANFFYQWQQSTDNVHYADIGGETRKDYDPKKITQTTYYRRVVTYSDNSTCATPDLSNVIAANVAVANVSNNTIFQPVTDDAIICSIPADPKPITGSTAQGTGFTYQWQISPDSINFTNITGVITQDYDPPQITRSTFYRRAAVILSDNCVAPLYSNIISIHVSPTATANTITSPRDTMFCDAGDAGVIYGSEVTGNGVHYQWQSSPDNITYTDIIDPNNGPAIYPNYDPPPGTSTVYYRRSVTTSVCNTPSVTRALAIQVFKTPVVAISDSVTLCAGSTTTLTASGGANYKWSPAQGLSSANVASPVASPDATTTYQVAVSNGGCSVNASVKVIVIPKPVVDAGPDQKIFRGETAQLNGKVTGNNVQYSWSPATYLDDPTILNPKATPPASITYTLTAITNYGCNIITDDVHLEVYEKVTVPTAFTPNNDGKNDTWEIVGLSTYPRSVTTIFNRDGMQLFRSIGYSKPWDGTFNGKPMPFGTYYYVIDLKDGFKLLSGWVALVK